MNFKKNFLVSMMTLSIVTTINYSASEIPDVKGYAPIHPTNEEVEKVAATDVVTIPDANLEACLKDQIIGYPAEITVEDMESITMLMMCENKGISDLTGLEYATNIDTLRLKGNNIVDLSPISDLNNVTYLDLDRNPNISDLSPISGYNNLETLYLVQNSLVNDLSPLGTITSLQELDLSYTGVSDISPLSTLTSLNSLKIISTNVNEISALASLENLIELDLSFNNITDISPLSALINLNTLNLGSNSISDISPLSALTSLNSVELGNQSVQLDDIIVDKSNIVELFGSVIDIDGNEIQISLGTPSTMFTEVSNSFSIPTSIGTTSDDFSGRLTQAVEFIESELTALPSVTINEENELSNQELIEIFEASNNLGASVSVDDSAVDYSKPGTYDVIFTDSSSNEVTSELIISDVLPEISTTITEAEILLGDKVEDFITLYGLTATEISDGDLTDQITIDATTINYDETGTYSFTVSVEDEEGNEDSTELSLAINRDETTIVDPLTPSIDTDFKPEIKGLEKAETNEESVLSDEQLINLFEISASDHEDGKSIMNNISVDQSLVDYSTPGLYNITFTVTDSDNNVVTYKTQLEIIDLVPTLEVDSEEIILDLNSNVQDLQGQINDIASEIVKGDLTDKIVLDDSKVDYGTAGLYDVILSVEDEEGNYIQKIVSISVVEDSTDIISELTDEDIEDSIIVDLTSDSEGSTETVVIKEKENNDGQYEVLAQDKDEYIEMKLEETGANSFVLLAILTVCGFAMITLKRILKK